MPTKSRKYETTHPWITFGCDTTSFSHEMWMNFGEARSKCEHIAGVPLQPRIAGDLHEVYMTKGVWGTTSIEGNTLTESQVREYIEGELALPPSQEYLGQEVSNIVEALNGIARDALNSDSTSITVDEIKQYNRLVLKNLELEEGVVPGEFRDFSVVAGNYRGAPAEDCEYLLDKMCTWLNNSDFCPPDSDDRVVFGLLRAILAHIYLAWIHPFGDGNGRVARLLEFKILVTAGLPSPAAHLLSNHYNLTRQEYYRQLQKASRSRGNITSFVDYALTGLIDGLKDQLRSVKLEQWNIAWRDYIYELFREAEGEKESKTDKRRRHLILDLSTTQEDEGEIPLYEVTMLSPRVAADYASLTRKTMMRDLRALRDMNLVELSRNKVRARKEVILAFLPERRTD